MGFPREEYWSGFPLPSPGDILDPEIEPISPTLQAAAALQTDSLQTETPGVLKTELIHI